MRQIFGALAAFALMCVPVGDMSAAAQSTRSVTEEFTITEDAFRDGRIDVAVASLERAVDQGSLWAMMRLGNLYADGKAVTRDELKACQLFNLAADKFHRLDKFYSAAHLVSEAFRRTAACYAKGLPGWDRDLAMAAKMYQHAGLLLEDPIALFELGKLYLTESEYHNAAIAARHLEAAARKRYPPAQALLGFLMWEGKHIKQRKANGLALMLLGKEGTSPEDRAWISTLSDDAMITASEEIEREAMVLVDNWKAVNGGVNPNALQVASPPVPSPSRAPGKDVPGLLNQSGTANAPAEYGSQPTRAYAPPPQQDTTGAVRP